MWLRPLPSNVKQSICDYDSPKASSGYLQHHGGVGSDLAVAVVHHGLVLATGTGAGAARLTLTHGLALQAAQAEGSLSLPI